MFDFPDVSLVQGLLVAAVAFGASIIGGMAGYGTGLLLPLVLVPIIGAESTVPVIAVTALFTNFSRAIAMRDAIDWPRFWRMVPPALPMATVGAWLFARLDQISAQFAIGAMLVVLVPLRRLLKRAGYVLPLSALPVAGAAFGLVAGGTTGVGVILVSFLMASGLAGTAVIATDAAISIAYGIVKSSTFVTLGALPLNHFIFAVLIGCATVPGAFIARVINDKLPVTVHTLMLDAAVVIGGLVMIARAIT